MDNKYLSEEEEVLISAFVKNEKMFEAVKKVLLAGLTDNGVLKAGEPSKPTTNAALALYFNRQKGSVSNEELGADLRAYGMSCELIQSGFDHLKDMEIKNNPPEGTGENPAR